MRYLVAIASLLLFFSFTNPTARKIQINGLAQGTSYHITYYADDSSIVKGQFDSILRRIDESLSIYIPNSLVNQFNASRTGVVADKHLMNVVKCAQQVWKSTNGLFDITVLPITNAWGFGVVKPDKPPTEESIAALLPCVNSNLLYWQGNKLMKKKPCVQIDPNGIAQGYTVDVLANFLEQYNIHNYLVELGGEIRVKGVKWPTNERMSIGIEAPGEEIDFAVIEKVIYPPKGAITTSGSYRRYIESKGQKITHLFNPKTGMTLRNELLSVTVFAKDAMTADAYDNALMAMGLKKALAFVDAHPELAAHFIYFGEEVEVKDTMSRRFIPFTTKPLR